MRKLTVAIVAALITVVGLAGAPAAHAGPVKCAEGDSTPDDRVFPEPTQSLTFLRFDEFNCAIEFLESQYPDLIEVTTFGESVNGHPLHNVLVTDKTVEGPKEKLLVVNSIHGGEVGGREGAVRNIEDLVDPRFLGDEPWVKEVLSRYVIHFLFPNPDGWVAGDIIGTPNAGMAATRGNGNGFDLNRQFPVKGYIATGNQTFSQPEAHAVVEELFTGEGKEGWYLGTDNHGQGPDTYAAAGLQIVGEFDFQKSETLARFADGITEKMAEYNVLDALAALNSATGMDMGAYHWGTLYDMLGYSASGSLIDYYNTADTIDGWGFATELTVGLEVNSVLHPTLLNQVWVDSIRAINYTMFEQAIDKQTFTFPVGGQAAYVFDPEVIRHDDENGPGFFDPDATPPADQQPYEVTRMKFFDDLNEHADRRLSRLRVADIASGAVDLQRYDSIVLANDPMPEAADADAYYGALREWIDAGGNLIVTDAAVEALPELGLLDADDIEVEAHYVGSVEEFTDRSHPLNAGLRGVASQTYDTVPIGYAFGGENTAPNWKVDRAAWEEAGGYTAGLNGTGKTIYGELPAGEGRVRFLGALLPDPTEEYYHPYGLQNYAVVYTGYTLLENMLDWSNPARAGVHRVAGDTRIETAVAISQRTYPHPDDSDAVVLSRADDYADALAGGPLAARLRAPVLLTGSDTLPDATRVEVERLDPERIVLLGGDEAIGSEVELELRARHPDAEVERISGADRFETAAAVAGELGDPTGVAFVAEGRNPDPGRGWPDALSASPYAAFTGAPILLVDRDRLPEATAEVLADQEVDETVVVGGPAAVSDAVVAELAEAGHGPRRVAGETRYETAIAVLDEALEAGMSLDTTWLATGLNWPDALTAGPAVAAGRGALALVHGADLDRSPPTKAFLEASADAIGTVNLLGGPAAISEGVATAVEQLLAAPDDDEEEVVDEARTAGVPEGAAALLPFALVALPAAAVGGRRRRRVAVPPAASGPLA